MFRNATTSIAYNALNGWNIGLKHSPSSRLLATKSPLYSRSQRDGQTHRKSPKFASRVDLSQKPAAREATAPRISSRHKGRNGAAREEGAPEAEPPKRLLLPHVLSARLKKLCDEGNVDNAVSLLKNAPLDAQNTQVWNTLIWECMKAKRFRLSYELFIDVSANVKKSFTRLSKFTSFSPHSDEEAWV
jgi:hypothetical protein